jgi:hypothetical protein
MIVLVAIHEIVWCLFREPIEKLDSLKIVLELTDFVKLPLRKVAIFMKGLQISRLTREIRLQSFGFLSFAFFYSVVCLYIFDVLQQNRQPAALSQAEKRIL